MPHIYIQDIDETIIQKLTDRAKAHGHSLEEEARSILVSATIRSDSVKAWDKVMEIRKMFQDRQFDDCVELIREDRDR